jgi:hypothetical protein
VAVALTITVRPVKQGLELEGHLHNNDSDRAK